MEYETPRRTPFQTNMQITQQQRQKGSKSLPPAAPAQIVSSKKLSKIFSLAFLVTPLTQTNLASGQTPSRGITFHDIISSHLLPARTYDPNDIQTTCYAPLYDADVDGDGIVQSDEYVTFIAELSEGQFDVDKYKDLPFVLKVNFVYLSCLCEYYPRNTIRKCCEGTNGGIYTSGAGGFEVPTPEEELYLETVCNDTQGSIEYAKKERMPSAEPTKGSPSDRPSPSPVEVVSYTFTLI